MQKYSLAHHRDDTIARNLKALDERELATKAALLAHLAEFDERRLHVPAAFPSLLDYCMQHLGWRRQAALKRIRAARTARRYPAILDAVERGRLNVSSVVVLSAQLTPENAQELIDAAAGKSKAEVENMLATRGRLTLALDLVPTQESVSTASPFESSANLVSLGTPISSAPHRDPTVLESDVPPGDATVLESSVSSGEAGGSAPPMPIELDRSIDHATQMNSGPHDPNEATRGTTESGPAETLTLSPAASFSPPRRFPLHFMMDEEMRNDLEYARELLGHSIPHGSTTEIIRRALKTLIRLQERRKCGADKSRMRRAASNLGERGRHIPAAIRIAVWRRDEGRCTFVSADGRRCKSRRRLEFDHIQEFARGGESTVDNLRLLCRVHNQHTAEQSYGRQFMQVKREKAKGKPTKSVAGLRARVQEGPILTCDSTEAAGFRGS